MKMDEVQAMVEQLLERCNDYDGRIMPDCEEPRSMMTCGDVRAAAAMLTALSAEVQRLSVDGIHTCHDQCTRTACVLRRERDQARAEVAEAVERIKDMLAGDDGQAYGEARAFLAKHT